LGTPTKGKFTVFDDAHDGKELCYTSFKDGAKETVSIVVKNPDGTDFPGSGSAVTLDVSETYNTSPDPVPTPNPPSPPQPPSPPPVVQPSPTSKLNDTGITQCGNATSNAACPQVGFAGQDAEHGRDATQATNNDTDGHRGFSFTKISSTGQALPVTANAWSCVKDNVTGLIWEAKTDDSGLHDKDDRYTWYNPDNTKNGGSVGTENTATACFGYTAGNAATYCNTSAYAQRVNTAGWCGASSGWRMPSVTELQSIADLSRSKPAIDTAYFPNTAFSTNDEDWWESAYWSSTPVAEYASLAWDVTFYNGDGDWGGRGGDAAVRLVRSGQ
jgi:hypothetical protein